MCAIDGNTLKSMFRITLEMWMKFKRTEVSEKEHDHVLFLKVPGNKWCCYKRKSQLSYYLSSMPCNILCYNVWVPCVNVSNVTKRPGFNFGSSHTKNLKHFF